MDQVKNVSKRLGKVMTEAKLKHQYGKLNPVLIRHQLKQLMHSKNIF